MDDRSRWVLIIIKLKEIFYDLNWFMQISSGHPGGSLGCAEFHVALYFETMKHTTTFSMDGKWFIFHNGHAAPGLFSNMAVAGYFPESEIEKRLKSRKQPKENYTVLE